MKALGSKFCGNLFGKLLGMFGMKDPLFPIKELIPPLGI